MTTKKVTDFKQMFKKRCFIFSLQVLKLSQTLYKQRVNWILLDQLVRSSTSIGANIVEGSNSVSTKEFINYFQISLKSASETLYWLSILKELNQDKRDRIGVLLVECLELKKIISTIILNTKQHSKTNSEL